MTKIQIINNGNSITTVTYDGDTIIFEVNDKLDYKTGGIVENPKEIKFKPDGVVNEITFNKRELELVESLYQTTLPLNTKSYEGEIFNDSSFSPSVTKQEQYRKKEIDKNRRLRKELKKARKKIAEYKKAIAHICNPSNNPSIFIIRDKLHFSLFDGYVMVFNGFNLVHFSYVFIDNFIERNYNIKNHPSKKVCFEFEGKPDHKLKELIELNPNYKVEFV